MSLAGVSGQRWSASSAWDWHNGRPWRVGCNFAPSSAINQLEMWQPETFDEPAIDRELGWLAALGMNCVRVFLHDLVWAADSAGYLRRIERFLEIASRHGISTLLVFFDSCWDPRPKAGLQPPPRPGVHNSHWVQSPELAVLHDPAAFDRLEPYVTGVMSHFRNDPRVEGWDLWNEPDNPNSDKGDYAEGDFGEKKGEVILGYLKRVFEWARRVGASQPLTSGVWAGDWSDPAKMHPLHTFQIEASDIVSFHNYGSAEEMAKTIGWLKRYERPLMCTEYMARVTGNTFQAILPILKQDKIGAYNWGAVAGKTQTIYSWSSWQTPVKPEDPEYWFHDILRPDGTPYDERETTVIRQLTAK